MIVLMIHSRRFIRSRTRLHSSRSPQTTLTILCKSVQKHREPVRRNERSPAFGSFLAHISHKVDWLRLQRIQVSHALLLLRSSPMSRTSISASQKQVSVFQWLVWYQTAKAFPSRRRSPFAKVKRAGRHSLTVGGICNMLAAAL